jgi:hypothetical protein
MKRIKTTTSGYYNFEGLDSFQDFPSYYVNNMIYENMLSYISLKSNEVNGTSLKSNEVNDTERKPFKLKRK